uniref:BBS1 domain-containing protein n=1 Tax=Trichuris muris TaxID=70415 RepID=A0A5S6QZC8_TRIMR
MASRYDTRKNQGESSWWLDCYSNCSGIRLNMAINSGMTLIDVNGDGDWKLVVCDIQSDLCATKVKLSTSGGIIFDETVAHIVSAVASVATGETDMRMPTLAIACLDCLCFYRNMRPLFRLPLPSRPICDIERQIWDTANDPNVNTDQVIKAMDYLKSQVAFSKLSITCQQFFAIKDAKAKVSFIEANKKAMLKCSATVTCLATIKKSLTGQEDVDWLLAGTELGAIFLIDCSSFNIQWTSQLPATPCFIAVKGAHNQDHRILVCCRNSNVYALKRTTKETIIKSVLRLRCQAVGMTMTEGNLFVGTMDDCLGFYTTRGKKIWSKQLPSSIIAMSAMNYPQKNFQAVLVSLANCSIHVYKDDGLCNIINVDSNVTALCFGCFGRDKGVLIMAMASGNVRLKLLRKNAKLTDKVPDEKLTAIVEQQRRLPLPKKTKLFVDQANRERDNYRAMHERYQKGLLELRISTATAYISMLEKKMNPVAQPIGGKMTQQFNLSVQLLGFGPRFCLEVHLTATSEPSHAGFVILFLHDPTVYRFDRTVIEVPFLFPNCPYECRTYLTMIKEQINSPEVVISVQHELSSEPIQTASILMPPLETFDV